MGRKAISDRLGHRIKALLTPKSAHPATDGAHLFLAPINWLRRELGMSPVPHWRPSLILEQLVERPQWSHLRDLREADLSVDTISLKPPRDLLPRTIMEPFDAAPAINRLHLAGRGNWPPFAVKVFRDVIFAHRGERFCVLQGNRVDAHSTALPGQLMVRLMDQGRIERVSEMAYCGDRFNPNNPAHYVCDQLARALMVRDGLGMEAGNIYLPVTTAPVNTALRTALDPAFREAHTNRVYHVDRLIMCEDGINLGTRDHPFHYCDAGLMDTTAKAARGAAQGGRTHGRRVYLSREGQNRRPLLNEPELIAALESHGVTPIRMEGLSGPDQLATIAGADLVIAPHGGALATLVAARPGARCVELFNPKRGTVAFALIAARQGLSYKPVFGTPEGEDGGWRVDIDAVIMAAG